MIKIAQELLKINAVFLSPSKPFTWASGIKSPIYCDNRLTLSYPKTRAMIEVAFSDMIIDKFGDVDCIVGTATAGIGHAAIIAHILGKPMAYVRGSAKGHGRQNLIEGHIEKGSRVVVIEDLISTGKSSIECVNVLKEYGVEVVGVAAIFTYLMEKSITNFKDIDLPLYTLSDLDELIAVALENQDITFNQAQAIKAFRDCPSDESWINKAELI